MLPTYSQIKSYGANHFVDQNISLPNFVTAKHLTQMVAMTGIEESQAYVLEDKMDHRCSSDLATNNLSLSSTLGILTGVGGDWSKPLVVEWP
jgi:hypothetical protein